MQEYAAEPEGGAFAVQGVLRRAGGVAVRRGGREAAARGAGGAADLSSG
jgi:hypothetical protein